MALLGLDLLTTRKLLLLLLQARGEFFQLAGQLPTLFGQGLQLVAFAVEQRPGRRHIQGLVGADRRVRLGAAQRAGFTGLQLGAMGFESLDALLLLQQFFLGLHLLLQVLVAQTQLRHLGSFGLMLLALHHQGTGQLGLLGRQALPGRGQFAQLGQYTALDMQLLPTLTQVRFTAPGQQRLLLLLRGTFLFARLLQAVLFGTELLDLLAELRLQGGDAVLQLLLAQLQLGDFPGQLLACLQLLTPTAQLLTQTAMLRLRGQLLLQLLQALGQLLTLRLAIGQQQGADFAGLPAVLGNSLLNLALLGGILL